MRRETIAVHAGHHRTHHGETSEALFLTSGFVYETAEQAMARFEGEDAGFVYSRYGNPTVAAFEERLALLEGGERAFATSSGMAAMFAAMIAPLKAGDHLLASRALFGSCHHIITQLLPRYGIATSLVDGKDEDEWRAGIRPNTKMLFCESPSNPCLELVDLKFLSHLAHQSNALLVVDNVFATPSLQAPIALGADVVAYSTTKHIDGQGRCLGGAIITTNQLFEDCYQKFLRNTGPSMSPFNAWVMLKGLETLDLRVHRTCDHAEKLAQFLADHQAVTRMMYPHHPSHPQWDLARQQMSRGGTLVAFELADQQTAFSFLNKLKLISISNNLGDAKSLITHPASTTHAKLPLEEMQQLGIGPGTLRLSVGLEHADDLMDDLDQALSP
ncbi:MAG TPA: O-succinylhomoserine sulfhydrylase [Alphaproteobacteria bacterium]|nr:O-succinylhomoserine sulfhydrylase [Alphaproteobacteria bacterium]HCY48300.1 O-succinylhomoserine sulfhydrylase [Alphaproteobacteria bacterium]|tara:strand:- start:2593 stop:3753 length:1161 start_codon:yes stop_codon:yes gene_type:complete